MILEVKCEGGKLLLLGDDGTPLNHSNGADVKGMQILMHKVLKHPM